MVGLVADFFQITGISDVPPQNLAELIPYILRIVVGVCLFSATFSVIGSISRMFTGFRRW